MTKSDISTMSRHLSPGKASGKPGDRTTTMISPDAAARVKNNSSRQNQAATESGNKRPSVVTPVSVEEQQDPPTAPGTPARRTLFNKKPSASLVSPSPVKRKKRDDDGHQPAKKRLVFGKLVDVVYYSQNVKNVYKIVKKLTGSIGGNANSGPIYGELTMGSMHKMIQLMIDKTHFGRESKFIDVGSGIGKPNLHVAQHPGVAFSCGVEVEESRWALGMTCLKAVLTAATKQAPTCVEPILGNTVFLHEDISGAQTFDPFTHVYMFSIGFPPTLWLKLADMWNSSESEYLICYHSPKDIVENYAFQAKLLAQTPTSMHGSSEGHTGYVYQRTGSKKKRRNDRDKVDPLFQGAWDLVMEGLPALHDDVNRQVSALQDSGRNLRSR